MKKAVMRDYYKCMCCLIALFIMSYPLYSQFSKNNLLFWVRSDTLLTTTGSSLNIWNDISGNNFNFIAISSPTVNTSNPSGFTSIFFDNSSLLSNNVTSIANFEAFIVYKKSGGVNVYERLIDHNYLDGFWIGRNNNSSHNFGGGYKNAVTPFGIFDDFPDTIANIMHVCKKNNIHSVSNGISSTITQTLSNFSPTLSNKITIGCDLSQTGNLKGDIFEIIFFNDSIRNSVKDSIFTYLKNKYASPINLPADISLTNTLCDTIIKAKGNFNSYHWSTGATTSSITVSQSGKYWVKATNIFGKISSDTINVSFPDNFPQKLNLCGNQPKEWNTQLPKNQFTFLWQDNSTDSLLTISSPGIYSVTISDGFGCSASHSINVTQDNFSSTTSLGPDLALCAGNQIALTTGIQPGLTYTWSTGQNAAAITVTNTGQYSVIVTNTNNCVAKDTIDVTITGFAPEPQFTTNIACKNQTAYFTNLSLAPPGNTITSYFWNFGDPLSASNTSTLTNPSFTYTNTGIYTVSLSISTDVGCSKSIVKTLTVSPTPTVNYVNSISCQNDSTSFTGSAITAPLTVSSYQWNFGDPASGSANNAFVLNPKHLFSTVAFFPVKFLVTNSAGCKDSITKNINVRSQVKADFTYQPPCSKTNVFFQDNSIVPNPSASHPRIWVLALQTNTFTFSGLSFSNTFTTTGVYPLSLTVNGTNGCTSTISRLIQIYQKPSVDFEIPSICLNDTIQILNNSLPGSGAFNQFSWALNSNTISSTPSPTLNFNVAGTYSLSLTVSNTAQCKDSVTKTFTVNPLPNLTFTSIPPTYIYKDSTVTFVPSVISGNSYNWTIGGQNYNTATPSIHIDSVGTYSVNLFLIDENGCKNSSSGTFKAYDSYLDLEVNSVIANITSNNFLNVQVDVTNKGTIPIANFEIKKTVSDASQVKETFNGIINPGVSYRYQFNSEDNISANLKNRLICLELESVNKRMDQNTKNNQLCDALNSNEIQVFEPQPNPANQIDVLLPVIVTYNQEVKVDIINSIGELVSPQYSVQLNEGINYIKIPSSGLSHGTYMIRVLIEDKAFVKKLLKY